MLAFASQHCGAAVSSPFLLDDFSTVRYNSAVPADLLWECLSNNGGGTTNCHHENGAYVSSGGIGHYVHFFPIPYVWPTGFMQHYIRSGTFSANTNRLVFWTKGGITWDATGAANIGTYSRPHASGDYPNSGQGWHFYHQHNGTMYADRWTKWQLNPHPNGLQGGGGSYYPSNEPIIADHGTTTKYFDGLTRWYIDITGQPGATTNYIANVHGSVVTGEDQFDACCGNMTITYSGTFYHVAFSAPKGVDNTFEVRYSNQDMHVAGFASGTSGGTIAATGTDYVYVRWNSPNMAVQPHFYVAIRRVGDTDFGQIYLKNGGADPYDADGIVQQVGGSTHTVIPSAGAGGTISPNTAQTINSGSPTTFTVTPNSGYTASVGGTCGGSLVGTTYTTNAITGNCTVSAEFADTEVPTAPTYMDAYSASTDSVALKWEPSTDNVGVALYRVDYCAGYNCTSYATLGTTATTTLTHSGIAASPDPPIYRYRVRAEDAAGNPSAYAASIRYNANPTVPAFPGAQGSGATSKGGRGGTVYRVTSLASSGAGTLRDCVLATGPRTCVFAVGGTIDLTSSLVIGGAYITVAGNTAPGGGITLAGTGLTGDMFSVQTHDVTIRNIRFRHGYNAGTAYNNGDSANIVSLNNVPGSVNRVIFDSVSLSWGQDENLGIWSNTPVVVRDVTISNSMLYEPLGPYYLSSLIGAGNSARADQSVGIDMVRTLVAQTSYRNPLAKVKEMRLVNDLIGNWRYSATALVGGVNADLIGNIYKDGSLRGGRTPYEISVAPTSVAGTPTGSPSLYLSGNKGYHNPDPANDDWGMVWEVAGEGSVDEWTTPGVNPIGVLPPQYRRMAPLSAPMWPISAVPATALEASLLPVVGASRRLDCAGNWVDMRDAQDARIVSEYTNGTGSATLLDSESTVGGYPTLAAGTACTDSDGDGMPDVWENANGLNAASAADGPALHASGYTHLERYLAGNGDLIAPVLSGFGPASPLAAGTTSATLALITDEPASCRYSSSAGAEYIAMTAFSTTGNTSHSASVATAKGRTDWYYIRCQDGSGNLSAQAVHRLSVADSPKRRIRR